MYHSLSIHLLKNILSAVKFWQLMSKAAINICVWVFCVDMFSTHWGKYEGLWLLDHVSNLCFLLGLEETATLSSKLALPFCIRRISGWISFAPHHHQCLVLPVFWILVGRWNLTVVLIFSCLITGCQAFFPMVICHLYSIFDEHIFYAFSAVINFSLSLKSSLYILGTILYQISILQIFPPSLWLVFLCF